MATCAHNEAPSGGCLSPPIVATVWGLPSINILPSGIRWATFGPAGGAARSPVVVLFFLMCRFSGKSQAWSLTAGDNGTMGIVFPLEGVTVRTSTYREKSRWKPKNRCTSSGGSMLTAKIGTNRSDRAV